MNSNSALDSSTFTLSTIGTEDAMVNKDFIGDQTGGSNYYTNLLHSLKNNSNVTHTQNETQTGGSKHSKNSNVFDYNTMSSETFNMDSTINELNTLNILGGAFNATDTEFTFNDEDFDTETVDTTGEVNSFDLYGGNANLDSDSSVMSFGTEDMMTMKETAQNTYNEADVPSENTSTSNIVMTGGYVDTKTHINVTKMISDACKTGSTDIIDFIFTNYRFKPDYEFRNENGDNIYHILCNCASRSRSAMYVLKTMLEGNMGQHILNDDNNNGDTPLHCAARNGLGNIVSLMISNGADRTRNSNNDMVLTETEADPMPVQPTSLTGNATADLAIGTVGTLLSDEDSREKIKSGVSNILQMVNDKFAESDTEFTMRDTATNANDASDINTNNAVNNVESEPVTTVVHENTESMIDNLRNKLLNFPSKSNTQSQTDNMKGGKSRSKSRNKSNGMRQMTITGTRSMNTYSEVNEDFESEQPLMGGKAEELEKVKNEFKKSRNDIHEMIIPKIEEVLKEMDVEYDNDTTKAIKAILYKNVKETMPHLNGLDRASETLNRITPETLADLMDKDDIKDMIADMNADSDDDADNVDDVDTVDEGEIVDEDNLSGGAYSDYDDYGDYSEYGYDDYDDYSDY